MTVQTIKTTMYDYSCLIIHHPDYGFLFLGRAQPNPDPLGSRWLYPAMQINSGECFDFEPHDLIGSAIMDGMLIQFKKEKLPR